MTRALVVGDLIDDIIVVPHSAVQSDTDTPSSISRSEGGSPANTAAWMASSDCDVTFVGRCGTLDVARHERALRQYGVHPMVQADAEHGTGSIVIVVDGETRTMLTDRGANDWLDLESIEDAVLATDVMHLTGYSLLAGNDVSAASLIDRAHAAGARVSCTLGSVGSLAGLGVERVRTALAEADILLANFDEGRWMTGLSEPHEIAEALADRWPMVALTMGSQGSIVGHRGTLTAVPSQRTALVDPTGAGDAFAAGFVAKIAVDGDAVAAAHEGARLAALAVAQAGARPSLNQPLR